MLPIWKFFIDKRQFTLLLIIGVTLWGILAAVRITKESTPEVTIPIGIVVTALPGSSAEDVERLVTNKIEERVDNIENLDTITSTSRDGVSSVVVTFLASADLDKSIQKLKDLVAQAKPDLPTEATDPTVSTFDFANQPIQIISISADAPFAKLAELGDELKSELQTVKGVQRIDVSGVRNREIDVVVKKEELARYGLSLQQVVSAIGSANSSLPVGAITVNNVNYSISFEGNFDNVTDIGSVAVLNLNGQVIYLRDIADVSDGVEKATSYSRISVNAKPSQQALTLLVYKVSGQDVTTVTKNVKAKVNQLNSTLLKGSQVVISYDAGDNVQKDLTELSRTGLETVILVMLALVATIGWREALVAGLSIPLSFLMAFVGLYYTGNTLNFISLFSLILSIGILVDSGIVVVEAIHTRILKYGDKTRAGIEALREYGWPLMGGTLTTVAVFFPLFFISGIVGKFIAGIPYTVIFVLIASIFVALGLVPMLTIWLARSNRHSALLEKQEAYAENARVWYAQKLSQLFANRKMQNRFLLGMIAAFVIAIALPVSGLLEVIFFPQGDSTFLYVDIEMPPGSSLNQTDLATRAIEEILYQDPNIASMVTAVGASSEFGGDTPQNDPRFANITLTLPTNRNVSSTEELQRVRKELSVYHGATIRASEPSGGPPVGAAVLVKYLGTDRDALDNAVTMARTVLQQTPGATSVDSSNKNESTEFSLKIDRAKLAQLGISPAQVASTLRIAVSGMKATSISGTNRDVDVDVFLNLNPTYNDPHEASNTTIDSLHQIPIQTQNGTVLLGSLLTEGVTRLDSVINHEDRKRVVTLTSDVLPGYTSGGVLAAFNKKMESVKLPEGVTSSVGGENEQTNQSFQEMGLALIAGLALMFVILVIAFNSFRYTTYLLSIVPLSLIGVFGGLTLTGQSLSFSSLLGVIALAGVIINHAIILMDSIIQRLKVGCGKKYADIIVEAATTRLRPIVLTTITTVIGMIPLTFASALWGPLAFAILFGLTFAMILTLVLIPLLVYRWPGTLPAGVEKK